MTIREKCPKCGTGEMSDPKFIEGTALALEHLERRCTTCGFKRRDPCADRARA